MSAKVLGQFPVHLGRGGAMTAEPEFGGAMDWYMAYGTRHAEDGAEGRLVSEYVFTGDWPSWERHPAGGELVYCLSGAMTLHQEMPDGSIVTTTLVPGQYAINPPGVWHTADVAGEARALFITAGAGTENRPR
jgi:mannose-6-phosphate isomerase-like protein (cupin superfamily)